MKWAEIGHTALTSSLFCLFSAGASSTIGEGEATCTGNICTCNQNLQAGFARTNDTKVFRKYYQWIINSCTTFNAKPVVDVEVQYVTG